MPLDNLRNNPRGEIERSYYFLDGLSLGPTRAAIPYGGNVRITERPPTPLERGYGWYFLRMQPTPLGRDRYFPYNPPNTYTGLGYVEIPHNEISEGMIVATDALSGCAIEVRYDRANRRYTFYHDRDGANALAIARRGGQQCLRIESDGYFPPAEDIVQYPCAIAILFIRKYGVWHVVASGGWWRRSLELCQVFAPCDVTSSTPRRRRYYGFFNSRTAPILLLNR